MSVPVYLTVRDRVSDLRLMVEWLERAGHDRIHLIDNASTWPPLLEYLAATPHTVIRLESNVGSQAIWQAGLAPDERFVLSDPDIVPCEDCPLDLVDHLGRLMDRHGVQKVGVGLMLDDVPPDMPSLAWEREFYSPDRLIEPGVYASPVDTTFALYERGAGFCLDALRTGAPYRARHPPWYHREVDEEYRWYLDRAMRGVFGTTSWPA